MGGQRFSIHAGFNKTAHKDDIQVAHFYGSADGERRRTEMSDNVMTEYRMEISATLMILFGLASLIGILGAVTGNQLTGFWGTFQDLVAPFGNWVYWLAFVGPIGFIFSLWWVLDFILKIRKLKDMINTESKARFIKNQDDIEYIAWRLPRKYKMLVARKKAELRIS